MVDNLAMLISHGLIALMVWRLLRRNDLDRDVPPNDRGNGEPDSEPPLSAAARRFARGD